MNFRVTGTLSISNPSNQRQISALYLPSNVKVGIWWHFSFETVSRYPAFKNTISENVHFIPASFHFRFHFQQNHFNVLLEIILFIGSYKLPQIFGQDKSNH